MISNICVVLGLVAILDFEVENIDEKTDFIYGDLNKEIYIEEPKGFNVKDKDDCVCKLNKSLYEFK